MQPHVDRYPGLYFEGFVKVAVGKRPVYFSIMRDVLVKHSSVFRHMLPGLQAEVGGLGSSEDNPIRLPEDDHKAFAAVMRVYHEKYEFSSNNPTSSRTYLRFFTQDRTSSRQSAVRISLKRTSSR